MGIPGRYSDLWLAACVVLLSCWGTWRTYAHVRNIERSGTAVLGTLPQGKNKFAILVDSKCVGEFALETAHESSYQIKGNLEVRTAFGKLPSMGTAKFNAEFNPIGQFTAGQLALELLGNHVQVTAANVNPIKITIGFGPAAAQSTHEFELPGPLSIVQSSGGQFQLEHKEQQSAGAFVALPFLRSAIQEAKLEVRPLAEGDRQCAESQQRINFEPFYTHMGLTLQHMDPFVFDR